MEYSTDVIGDGDSVFLCSSRDLHVDQHKAECLCKRAREIVYSAPCHAVNYWIKV